MAPDRTATREEWLAERAELRKLEDEYSTRGAELAEKRRGLPWVPVESEYTLTTDDGPRTLTELFDGRSQLLAYNIMFGPDYSVGACPGCSNLADHFDAGLVHLNHRDVTFVGFSRAPLERLQAYKERMGWKFPWVSTYDSDFAFDFDLAVSPEKAQEIDEIREMVEDPPDWLQKWSEQVGADLKDGLREAPTWIAFSLEDGVVYQTYSCSPPDRETGPYFYLLLDRTARGVGDAPPFNLRNDEYDEDTRL